MTYSSAIGCVSNLKQVTVMTEDVSRNMMKPLEVPSYMFIT